MAIPTSNFDCISEKDILFVLMPGTQFREDYERMKKGKRGPFLC